MKNWKRLTALGLSAMMLASLAGCSTTTSKTDPESGKNQAAENTGGSGKRITGRCTCIYVQIYRKFIWRSNV